MFLELPESISKHWRRDQIMWAYFVPPWVSTVTRALVLRRRFLEPGNTADVQTLHVAGSLVRQETSGMELDVPVPRKMTSLTDIVREFTSVAHSRPVAGTTWRQAARNHVSEMALGQDQWEQRDMIMFDKLFN